MQITTPNTENYWFILGREPLISAAEIDAVLGLKKYDYSPPILKINGLSLDAKTLIKRFGGIVKIAKEMASSVGEEKLKNIIIEELKKVEGKINFGLSFYSQTNIDLKDIKKLGLRIKKSLKEGGLSVRYVENREIILSSVAVEKNGLTSRGREFLIEKKGGAYSIAKTEAVQPFENFSIRDFGRPGRDDFSGMLPPKLALILINLAQMPLNSALLDPFCGSGTILSEASLLGYNNLIGADISEKAIADSKKNIEWIAKKFFPITTSSHNRGSSILCETKSGQINFQVSNVQNLSRTIKHESIDAIVTEPYLGKPLRGRETKQELTNQTKELKDLYLRAFRQFYQILKPKGKIVFIIPRFKYADEWITIDCKNEIEKRGFKTLLFFENKMPLLYVRPNQRVAREIWRFVKN
jgi:tRNA G10  N-methylase Trm11